METFKKEINSIQQSIRQLKWDLNKHNIDMELILDEMIECLAFISGYSERALETEQQEH